MATGSRVSEGDYDAPGPAGPAAWDPDGRQSSVPGAGRFPVVRVLPPRSLLLRHLGALPLFAGCGRQDLRRMARHGDVVEVDPSTRLLREDRPDYWFYVVLSGTVTLTRGGRHAGTLGRGGHVGETAIVGFGLQPHTAVAGEGCLLFVLGRRQLLTFAHTVGAFQRALFPESEAAGFDVLRHRMFETSRAQWDRIAESWKRTPATPGPVTAPAALRPLTVPGRPASRSSLALAWADVPRPVSGSSGRGVTAARLSTRARLTVAVVAASVVVTAALLYRPPLAVVREARPVDVVSDIVVSGREVQRPVGRYLLLSVRFEQVNALRTAASVATGKQVVRVRTGAAADADQRDAFLASERLAVATAAAAAGVDPEGLSVEFRDRGLRGPSAGLIYALALTDMLDEDDLARGRVIAATGVIDADGRVWPVGFVAVKSRVAKSGGARLLLVPSGQERLTRGSDADVRGVSDLQEALEVLRAS